MTTISPPVQIKLSDLAGIIDMVAFYERHGCIVSGKPTHSKEGLEYACSCPICGGTDRASFWDSGRFNCIRGCGWSVSSPYFFLREQSYSHFQALAELDIDPSLIGDSYSQQEKVKLPLFLVKDEPPNEKWIMAAAAFCHMAEKCLWSAKGKTAKIYLQSRRGLTEETIKHAHLGLCPDWYKAPLVDWGLSPEQLLKDDGQEIKIPRGIVIPWFVQGNIWKIQIRRPLPGLNGNKYFEVMGSSECLYNVDSIQPEKPVLLVESELDALSAQQEARELISCVATGSVSKALSGRNLIPLFSAGHVLQAFDDDEAGERGAAEWITALGEEKCKRWTPWAHDVNDMLTSGHSIKSWIQCGLTACEPFEELDPPQTFFDVNGKPVPPELVERVKAFQRRPCSSCGGYDWFMDNGWLTCPCIIPKRSKRFEPRPSFPLLENEARKKNYWK